MNQNKKFTGQKLYSKAKQIIPGGTMLLSKRPEMFLPDLWPSYYSKAKGCEIWDLDSNKYLDYSIMGIGTNTLGYSHDEVDNAVVETVRNGNMSTLNCPEEVLLAEKLIELNPWADMVRFARTGGEANAIAIRIARAASGKNKVAICGYHGWHDWYLSVNLNDTGDDLSKHLLPGLDPNGVPSELKNSVIPFDYNDYVGLEKIVNETDVGVITMEVIRNNEPEDNFLQKVRKLANDKNIVLIFDECTSGFRETFGGIHTKYNVYPDMVMYGKTLGNGYAITAVLGKKEVMEATQKTFISSTFWTERIGPTAALKTLEIMEREKSWNRITELGNYMRNIWKRNAIRHDINITISGLTPISTYSFNHKDNLKFKTYLTQEFLKKGFLASTNFYSSITHKERILDNYSDILEEIYSVINCCINGSKEIDNLLKAGICHSGFKRLN
jgi:glutamate-1-semialdehyde 2,1-aminomutase